MASALCSENVLIGRALLMSQWMQVESPELVMHDCSLRKRQHDKNPSWLAISTALSGLDRLYTVQRLSSPPHPIKLLFVCSIPTDITYDDFNVIACILLAVTAFQTSKLPSCDAETSVLESPPQCRAVTLPKCPFSVRRVRVAGGALKVGSSFPRAA